LAAAASLRTAAAMPALIARADRARIREAVFMSFLLAAKRGARLARLKLI
jgi:hypothetical protein